MSDLPFEIEEDRQQPSEPETLISNVLIVDDEPVVRDVFKRLLARETDMVVSVAEDAEQGLELIKQQRFELLITDKNLPGMGGIELIAEARAVRPMIEAVMITGYASSESLISAFAAGASDYLVKPFDDLKVVRAKVRAALQRRLDRSRSQISSKDVARQAAALLGQGKDAPEAVWRKLDTKFAEYERAIRDGGSGAVVVVGSERAVETLKQGGVSAQRAEPGAPELQSADVVIIETGLQFDWHPLAEKLIPLSLDVVLVAGPESDLSDLLEAISLRVDLVGFGGHTPARQLPDRVKANLMRRSVERAQKELAVALNEFKQSLRTRLEPTSLPAPEMGPGTGIEVNPPLAALAAVPLVNRPASSPPTPPRSPVTPSIPIPATVVAARQQRAAALVPGVGVRAPVTPSAPIPAAGAPAAPVEEEPRTPGPPAPRHKATAQARASTPSAGVPAQSAEAGGATRAPVPGAAAGPGGAPRRPTGAFPQIMPVGEAPPGPAQGTPAAAGPSGAPRRPTGSFPQVTPAGEAPSGPVQGVPAQAGPGGAPKRPTPMQGVPATAAPAGAPRRPTGSLPQITPPGEVPPAPAQGAPRGTSGSFPQIAPERPAAPGADPSAPGGAAPPAGLGARRPTGSFPQLSPPGAVRPDAAVRSVTPVPGASGAVRGSTPVPRPTAPTPQYGTVVPSSIQSIAAPEAGPPPPEAGGSPPEPSAASSPPESLPSEWAAPGSSAPATPVQPILLIARADPDPSPEPEISIDDFSEWGAMPDGAPKPPEPVPEPTIDLSLDDAFSEWGETQVPPPPSSPPPPAAPPRQAPAPAPASTPAPAPAASAAARRRAASPFPIMTVAEAESTLKAAQPQPPAPTPSSPHSMQGRPLAPPPAAAPTSPARRTTGSFPAAAPPPPLPTQPAAAVPPRGPAQAHPAEAAPPKPKPPNGGSR